MAVVRGAVQFIYLETTVSESLFTIHLLVAGRSAAAPSASPRSPTPPPTTHLQLIAWPELSTCLFLRKRRDTRDIKSNYQAIQASRGHCLSWETRPSCHVSTDICVNDFETTTGAASCRRSCVSCVIEIEVMVRLKMLVSICEAKKFLGNWSVDSWTTVEITRYSMFLKKTS